MTQRRVVITGLGMLSPVGNNVRESWSNILQGKGGTKPITKFDVSGFDTTFAASVEVDIESFLDKKEIRRTDPFIQFGLIASEECIKDSSVKLDQIDLTRFGVSIGSGIGGLGTIEENKIKLSETSPKKISPFFVPGAIANMVSGYASLKFGLKGPNISIASACSSASHSIGYSFRSIASNDSNVSLGDLVHLERLKKKLEKKLAKVNNKILAKINDVKVEDRFNKTGRISRETIRSARS